MFWIILEHSKLICQQNLSKLNLNTQGVRNRETTDNRQTALSIPGIGHTEYDRSENSLKTHFSGIFFTVLIRGIWPTIHLVYLYSLTNEKPRIFFWIKPEWNSNFPSFMDPVVLFFVTKNSFWEKNHKIVPSCDSYLMHWILLYQVFYALCSMHFIITLFSMHCIP